MSKWPTSRKSSETCPYSAYPLPALQPLIPSTLSAVSQLACSLALWPVCDQCLFPFLPLPLCLSSFALYFSIIHNFFHLGKVEHLALKRRVPECWDIFGNGNGNFIHGKSFSKYYKMIQDQLIIPN